MFTAIGASVFVMGLVIQASLTGLLHVSAEVSYAIQAVVSIESNFLMNRWLTWRDRGTAFWTAFGRFNAQRTMTVGLNLVFYFELIQLGMNYLAANVLLAAAFTVVNFVVGDRLVFTPARARSASVTVDGDPAETSPLPKMTLLPYVSVVIPCRNNERTIRAAVQSLVEQDYPCLAEIILIGSPGDTTWGGLVGIEDPRLVTLELQTPPGVRDANFKRDSGIRMASSELIALVDSDIVLPPDWMSRAQAALDESRASCVTGGIRSIRDDFWGRYTDHTVVGAKTPRVSRSYVVTRATFGAGGCKPPITANILFKRDLYYGCPIDPYWSHGSYEDYEWFWRVIRAGHQVQVCWELFGWHHHRRGMRALAKEYLRSSRGCAYFIRAHIDCPLARRRLLQATVLPLLAVAIVAGLVTGACYGYSMAEAASALGCAAVLAAYQVACSRRLEGIGYAATGVALGVVFTTGLVANLVRASLIAPEHSQAPKPTGAPESVPVPDRSIPPEHTGAHHLVAAGLYS